MFVRNSIFKFVVLLVVILNVAGKKTSPSQCEVCTDVLKAVSKFAESKFDSLTPENVKTSVIDYCKTVLPGGENEDDKKEKLCLFLGAHQHSATSIVMDVAKQLSFHKPSEKVCEELNKKDSQICEVKYDKPIDWENIDLSGMRVKQLKELLAKLKGDCKGCTEKSEYIARINELKPKPTDAKAEL